MKKSELNWLGGYFDGKGTVGLHVAPTKSGTMTLRPYMRIYGNPETLKYISSLDPKFKLKEYKYSRKSKGRIKHCKDDSLRIESQSLSDILELSALLMDYCVIKKERLNLMREAIIIYGIHRSPKQRPLKALKRCRARAESICFLNRKEKRGSLKTEKRRKKYWEKNIKRR